MLIETDVHGLKPLRCPRCGNTGEDAAFNAATYVLIKEQGVPTLVGNYSQEQKEDGSPNPIDCHGCDYVGPIDEFEVS